MSDDQRASGPHEEPGRDSPDGARRWADYLEWLREDIVAAVRSLTEEEQRATHLPSGWTPAELLNHLWHMEQRWFIWGFLGEPVADPWGDWNLDEPWTADDSDETRPAARWLVPEGLSVEEIAGRLLALGDRTRNVLREYPMEATAATGGRFGDHPPTLEWICFHVLAEYARHAGHLDVSVEISRGAGDLGSESAP